MRILWISDSPSTPSGFGAVTRAVCGRLAARGHRVEILGWQTHGHTAWWQGVPVHPVRRDQFGADVLLGYMLRIRPEFVVTLGDVWWMAYLTEPNVQQFLDQSGARWVLYYPIDGADPNGQLPQSWVRVLTAADVPIAMSRFGASVTQACGVQAAYIPHGCDLDVFCPPEKKKVAKERLGYGGKFVVLSDARNQPRKLLPRTLDIVGMFAADKPDVIVHLHTDPDDDAAHSDLYRYELREDIKLLGLGERVYFTRGFHMRASAGLPIESLAAVYQAADVHVLASWGEGFGLPNLQAAAAGVVPIAVAYAASRELVEGHGHAVAIESVIVDEFGLVRCLLSREAAVNALNELYEDRVVLEKRSGLSRAFALDYDWDSLTDQWEAALRQAPPRRKPDRLHVLSWVTGGHNPPQPELPTPVATAASEVFEALPEGTQISVRFTERKFGEIATQIRHEAFQKGDELSLPVRLPPLVPGAPRAQVGALLVSPADLQLAARIKRIFPGVAISVPRPGGDPASEALLDVPELAPALLNYVLVIDCSGTGAPHLDLLCAALGIPYLGPSPLWEDTGVDLPLAQVRRLLTDQGLSEWRRHIAFERATSMFGHEVVDTLRRVALAGQNLARTQKPEVASPTVATPGDPQMFLVRARGQAPFDANQQITEYVSAHGGLVLMTTATGALIVAMGQGGKELLERHPSIAFVGGVVLDPSGKAVRALRQRFARNAAIQLAVRAAGATVNHAGLPRR